MISLIEEFFSNFYQMASSKFRYRSQKSEKLVWRLADFYVEQSQKRRSNAAIHALAKY